MKKLFALLSTAIVLSLSGCATLFVGSTQSISIDSNAQGAEITLISPTKGQQPLGKTPYSGIVEKETNLMIALSKEGYVDKRVTIETSYEMSFFLTILLSWPSSTTDLASKSYIKFSPSNIYVNMAKEEASLEEHKKDNEIKYFVLMNYSEIENNLTLDKGEHLQTLQQKVLENKLSNEEIKSILHTSLHNPVKFAETIAQVYFDRI